MAFITGLFRLQYPDLFEARAFGDNQDPKFGMVMLFPKDPKDPLNGKGEGILQIREHLIEAIKEKWGTNKAKWPGVLRSVDLSTYASPTRKDGWPIGDGDFQTYAGYKDHWFVRTSTKIKPDVLDLKRNKVTDPSEVWPGMICRAHVNVFAYEAKGNMGVSLGLNSVQIVRDDGIHLGRDSGAAYDDGLYDDGSESASNYDDEV